MESDYLFNVRTPLGFSVRTTRRYWHLNLVKHEAMSGREHDVIEALQSPDEVRISQTDSDVLLFGNYKRESPRTPPIKIQSRYTLWLSDFGRKTSRITPTRYQMEFHRQAAKV